MQVEIKTVYTKENLLKVAGFMAAKRSFLWILMAVATLLVFFCFAIVAVFGELDRTIWTCLIMVAVIDLLYLFFYLVYPRLTVNKAKNRDLAVTYVFCEEEIRIKAKNEYIDESSIVKYSVMSKVHKKGSDLYIFDTMRRIFYVDLSGAESKDLVILRELLEKHFGNKKIIWE